MAQTFNKLNIDVKEKINDIITAKQNDAGSRFLDVTLYDSGSPVNLTGHTVNIYMRKPDGTEVFNAGQITNATSGRCQFELTSQALSTIGILKCEISVWKSGKEILTTQTFSVYVTESLRNAGSVESSNEYGAMVVLFQELYEFRDLLEEAVASFTLKGVTDLLGTTRDSGGSTTAGTIMAKLNAMLNNWTSTRAGYLDTIKSNTDANSTANKTGTLSAKLAYVISLLESSTLLNGKIIKSVQRGTIQVDSGTTATKTINSVNMNKTVVNVTGVLYGGGGSSGDDESFYLTLTSSTQLTMTCTENTNHRPVAYEVIEFY